MRFKQLWRSNVALSIAGSVAIACLGNSQTLSSSAKANQSVNNPRGAIASIVSQQIMEGTFQTAEAPTSGKAKIVVEDGISYLVISSSFSTTDQAPDLQVLLDTVSQPPQKYDQSDSGRYINLGGIQHTMGEQRYPIPEVVNLSDIKSAVVWCRMANAVMGYAPLESSSTALAQ